MANIVLVSGVLGTLNDMRGQIVGAKLAAMGSLAAVIGGLLCAFVLLKTAHDYIEGQGITVWTVIKPFVILLCICNFNTFVAGPIHSLCNIFTDGMCRQTSVTAGEYARQFGNYIIAQSNLSTIRLTESYHDMVRQSGGEAGLAEQQEAEGIGRKIGRWFKKGLDGIINAGLAFAKVGLTRVEDCLLLPFTVVVNTILIFIMKLILFGQQVYCYVYLTILTLLGPFAFAFGILPSFAQSIDNWISRYVQVAFWIPVGQLVMFINYAILGAMGDVANLYAFGSGWTLAACTFVAVLNVTAVPKISAYVIGSTGANDAHRNVNAAGRTAGQAVVSVATHALI